MSENASSKTTELGAGDAQEGLENDLDPRVILNVLLAGAAAAMAVCIGWTLAAYVTELRLAFAALLIGPAVGAAAWSVAERTSTFVVTSSVLLTLLGVGVGYLMVQYYAGSQIEANQLAKDDSVVIRLLLVQKMGRKGVVPDDVRRYYLSEDFGLESQVELSPRLGRQVENLRSQTRQQVEEMSPAQRRKLVGDRLERLWKSNGAWIQMLKFEGLDYAWLGGSIFLALLFGIGFFAKEEDEERGEELDDLPLAAEVERPVETVSDGVVEEGTTGEGEEDSDSSDAEKSVVDESVADESVDESVGESVGESVEVEADAAEQTGSEVNDETPSDETSDESPDASPDASQDASRDPADGPNRDDQ